MLELSNCSAVGSVDIDTVLSQQYPNDPRWDFVIGVQIMGAVHKELIWIEVHPASSDSVSKVLAKLEWLKSWLKNNGGQLGGMTNKGNYYWLSKSGIKIKPGSTQARRLAQAGLKGPQKRLIPC